MPRLINTLISSGKNNDKDKESLMPAVSKDQTISVEETAPFDATHPPIRVTPDKSELLHLEKEAATIIVGNPEHANILMDNPKLLVVVPKMPGATYFTILDDDGKIVMQRHVIVASPRDKYVRIRRNCELPAAPGNSAEIKDCKPIRVYYCPDMCHEVAIASGDEKNGEKNSAPSKATDNLGQSARRYGKDQSSSEGEMP
jgi:hypothetical protein